MKVNGRKESKKHTARKTGKGIASAEKTQARNKRYYYTDWFGGLFYSLFCGASLSWRLWYQMDSIYWAGCYGTVRNQDKIKTRQEICRGVLFL